MKITKLQCITSLLVIITCLFMVSVLFDLVKLSSYLRAFILSFLVYLYFTVSENKSKFFAIFLISSAFAEFIKAFSYFDVSVLPRISNIAYIFGYLNLLLYIAKRINLKILMSKFKLPIFVLFIFNGYLIFTLNQMILADSTIKVYTLDFLIECLYNISILLLLSFSLINYLYHDSKKGLILFLASVCIVFSETVRVAYVFVSSDYILSVIYSILLIIGFSLVYFYIVSKMNKYYKVLF